MRRAFSRWVDDHPDLWGHLSVALLFAFVVLMAVVLTWVEGVAR